VVLGLGGDGHTASLFPGADRLETAVGDAAPDWVPLAAPGAPEPRVSASLRRLLATRDLIWHLGGEAKQEVLRRALGSGPAEELPARYVLRGWAALGRPLEVFTWPPLPPSFPMEPS
jgi:6-phosphogluconolactonase